MSQNKTLKEEWSKFYFEEGDEDLDVDKIADFFIDKMRERVRAGIILGYLPVKDEPLPDYARGYNEALSDLLDYLK